MSEKKNQRISEIYSYLMTHNYASVNELAQHFNVSISTIKRDLIEMEDKREGEGRNRYKAQPRGSYL